jgi:hypothetical protein
MPGNLARKNRPLVVYPECMTRELRWATAWPTRATRLLRVTLGTLVALVASLGVQTARAATPSPSANPSTAAQLSHTVGVFGLLFFGIAALAVVMFIVVVLRLRKS